MNKPNGNNLKTRNGKFWKRDHYGRYINIRNGWVIERSENGGWNVVNGETGKVFDNMSTKKDCLKYYE